MELNVIVFLLLFPIIYGDECFTYDFEEEFENFDPTLGSVCASVNNNWSLRQYESSGLAIDPPHPLSKTFITPVGTSSCVSSFFFRVENGSEVEVSVYMRSAEFMTIGIYNEAGQQVATWTSFANIITMNEWTTVTLTVSTASTEPILSYLSLFATVTADNTILVDSFRYMPPNQDADDIECAIYSNDDITDTESSTTEIDSTTETLTTENESSTSENNGTTETPSTENESSTTEINITTETQTTENESSTTEINGTTEIPTTENESSTTEMTGTTETPITENESSTSEIDGTTETPTTENESGTTEMTGTTETPITENESSTSEIDGTTETPTTENGSSTSVNDVTNETNSPDSSETGTTTDNYTTDIISTESNTGGTTDIPDYEEEESSFWTPLTIALIATGSSLVLLLIIYISYWCGKRKEKKKIPEILYLDIEELPKPVLVPRIKKVYTDSMSKSNPYAKDYL